MNRTATTARDMHQGSALHKKTPGANAPAVDGSATARAPCRLLLFRGSQSLIHTWAPALSLHGKCFDYTLAFQYTDFLSWGQSPAQSQLSAPPVIDIR